MPNTAAVGEEFSFTVSNRWSGESCLAAVTRPGVAIMPFMGEEAIGAAFPRGDAIERLVGKLIDLPFGTSDEEVKERIAALEPVGEWAPATPRQLAIYVATKGVKEKHDDSRPEFYILAVGEPQSFFFTNVDMQAVMSYMQFGPVIPGVNDYYWADPKGDDPNPFDRTLHYLAVRKMIFHED